jgi:branched-chain amino acid transport system substrate-binding protein
MKNVFRPVVLTMAACFVLAGPTRAQGISVGHIAPFTVLPSPDATEVNQGAQAYFDQINAAGGIGGKKIAFFKLDDKFNGDEFAKQLEVADAKKPIALITPIGSNALQKTIKENLLDKMDTVIINAIPGADTFRNPGHPRLFHIRASDGAQIAKIVQHVKTLGVSRLSILHQDLPIGTAGLASAQAIGQQVNIKIEGLQAKPDEASLATGAKTVMATRPESVLVIGSPKYMVDAIVQLRKAGASTSLYALSYLPPGLAAKVLGPDNVRGIGITQTYPNPNGKVLGLQREFQATMAKHAPDIKAYNSFHLEGYISARVLVEAMRRGGTGGAADVIKGLRAMAPYDLGGFVVDFSKSNAGSAFVDISMTSTGGKLVY